MGLIAGGALGDRQRPIDVEPRIDCVEGTFGGRTIGGGVKIKQFAVSGKRLEAVGETLGDNQRPVILRAQTLGVPAQEGRRTAAQIDGDVEDLTLEATDELRLGVGRRLKVQSPDRAWLGGQGVVDLGNGSAAEKGSQRVTAEDALQVTALIADGVTLQQREPAQGGRSEGEAVHGWRINRRVGPRSLGLWQYGWRFIARWVPVKLFGQSIGLPRIR